MPQRTLNSTVLSDILDGTTLLAGGGGGPVQGVKSLLQHMAEEELFPKMIPLEELRDDDRVTVPIAMGSGAVALETMLDIQMIRAMDAYEKAVGKVNAVIALEAGHCNVLLVLYTAAKIGVPVLDADGTGRAIPEFRNTVFYSSKVDPNPFALADAIGNQVLITASTLDDVDRIGRTVCTELGAICGTAGMNISGKEIKKIAIPNTLSYAEKLGRTLRENREGDAIGEVVKASNGFLLTKGLIDHIDSKIVHGHDYGNLFVNGIGKYRGKRHRIAFKNEGLITYDGSKPVVISPDHVFMIDLFTHRPVTFTDLVPGQAVAVIALRVNPRRRTPEDYDGFRPSLKDVGYTGEYVPVEKLLGK